jgi:hypothetical protein
MALTEVVDLLSEDRLRSDDDNDGVIIVVVVMMMMTGEFASTRKSEITVPILASLLHKRYSLPSGLFW